MPRENSSISVRELAKRLGISTATVSRALNNHPEVSEATRARVLDLADQTGYQPRVGQRYHKLIGLVYPSHPVRPDIGSFESALISGVMRGLSEQRYDLTMIDVRRDLMAGETMSQFFRRKHVRGVIVRTISPTPELAERIAMEGFPHVMVADRTDVPSVNFVCADSGEQSYQAVSHLIHNGHRRIGLVMHSVPDSDHMDRLDGYRRCLRDHGIELDDTLELALPATMEAGGIALERMLRRDHAPTALYFTDPLPGMGALHRCLELGIRVPDQLSIIGFDDADIRLRTFPRMTAVCQDAEGYGYDAARWLTRSLEGFETGHLRSHRPTTFEVLESSGMAPSEAVQLGTKGAVGRGGEGNGTVLEALPSHRYPVSRGDQGTGVSVSRAPAAAFGE